MASYAPLFAHAEGWQWTPDLIWVNNLESIGTTDYYVQQLFSIHKGTRVVPITSDNKVLAGEDSLYASASLDEKNREVIIKLVNASSKEQQHLIDLQGAKKINRVAKLITLASNDLSAMNSFEDPTKVAPKESTLNLASKKFVVQLNPYSVNIYKVKLK